MSPLRRRALAALAVLSGAGAVLGFAASGSPAQGPPPAPGAAAASAEPSLVEEGRALFGESCSSCHGTDGHGIRGLGPDLHGAGEQAADFYLRTGRMPLSDPRDEPRRARPSLTDGQIHALVAYVGTLGGPPIPTVDPSHGDVAQGMQLFATNCMGCHQVQGRGGITTGAIVPTLQQASATDVAEAIAIGPYVMPQFRGQFDRHEIDSLARYVLSTRHPDDVGGWGLGHIGPIPEGMVTWLLAAFALVLVMRLLGERTTR